MNIIHRLILALVLSAGLAPAFAQAPPPVPALPDTERRTSYTISASTCACNVNFALYGDSTDYVNWLEVFVNGALVPQSGNWTITSPTGPLATIPRPITDAVLTFTVAQTGTVQIVGARRPRRTSQFNENAGVSARNLNQVFTDIIAQNREIWDKTNDFTGRSVRAPPGETLNLLPAAASRLNLGACFDGSGNLTTCVSIPSSSLIAGTLVSFSGSGPTTINVTPTASGPLVVDPTTKNITCPTCSTTNSGSYNIADHGAVCDGVTDDTTAITNTLALVPSGGKMIVPSGVICLIKGSGAAIFTRTTPIFIDCQGSMLFVDSSVPNTRDIFLFSPPAFTVSRRWRVTNCYINANNRGNHVFNISALSSNTTELAEFWIDHVTDAPTGNASGYSIFVGNVFANSNGGVFNANFSNNYLSNGINLTFAGDSIRIKDSIITGTKFGVYANIIAGAGGLMISGNNITAADPLLLDAANGNTVIVNNEFEQLVTNTDPANAVVDLRGGIGTITLVTFTGNSINALAGTGSPNPLRISNVAQAYVESNAFTSGAAGSSCIVNTAGGTIIGASNSYSGCTTHVSNSGILKYVQVGASP